MAFLSVFRLRGLMSGNTSLCLKEKNEQSAVWSLFAAVCMHPLHSLLGANFTSSFGGFQVFAQIFKLKPHKRVKPTFNT